MSDDSSHWNPGVERRGLGNAVLRVNHIAIVVADVGISASFYADVLGLQQIRRPDFYRHGAWFTMGNCELHLIKGIPIVPDGANLIVPHLSLDVDDTTEVLHKLASFGIPFEQNVAVPKGVGKAAAEGGNQENTVVQFFLRDPDGYYIELCNCNILTDFCFNRTVHPIANYEEGILMIPIKKCISFHILVKLILRSVKATRRLRRPQAEVQAYHNQLIETAVKTDKVNEVILGNLLKRRFVYGDIVQSFKEDEIRHILQASGNQVPIAILMMKRDIETNYLKNAFQPPGYFKFDGYSKLPYNFFIPKLSPQLLRKMSA